MNGKKSAEILALSALASLALASNYIISKEDKSGSIHYEDFSPLEETRINNSIDMIRKGYKLPFKINFIQDNSLDSSGKYLGIIDNLETIKLECIDTYTSNYIYHLNSPYDLNMPYTLDPLENLVIHEVGHIFFSNISKSSRSNIIEVFKKSDSKSSTYSKGHPAHASYLSYFYMVDEKTTESLNESDVTDLVNEQFSETFLYLVHGHTNRDFDEIFNEKKNAVSSALKVFEKTKRER